MKLIDYGTWTIFMPFFSNEPIRAYDYFFLSTPKMGTTYLILNGTVQKIFNCIRQEEGWREITPNDRDLQLFFFMIDKENIIYENQ
jgi:hypothetical protein